MPLFNSPCLDTHWQGCRRYVNLGSLRRISFSLEVGSREPRRVLPLRLSHLSVRLSCSECQNEEDEGRNTIRPGSVCGDRAGAQTHTQRSSRHQRTQRRRHRAPGIRLHGRHGQRPMIFRRAVRFKREFKALSSDIRDIARAKFALFSSNWRHHSLRCHKLEGVTRGCHYRHSWMSQILPVWQGETPRADRS